MTFQKPHHRYRTLAALVVPLFVLGLMLEFNHRASYRHEVCPLDGEVAHVDEGHGHSDPHERSDHESPEEDDHEHCGLPSLGTAADSPKLASTLSFAHLADSIALAIPAAHPIDPAEALFLLAPKNSPPRGR